MREVSRFAHSVIVTLPFPISWFRGRSLPAEGQRQARLLRVLDAAMAKTAYARGYRREELDRLPKVDLLDFLRHTERYSVAKAAAPREALLYPIGAAPRTAVVGRAVIETRRVQCFSALHSERFQAFAPQAIAAPLDAFRAAPAEPAPLRNAVIVFSGILQGPVTPEDGDRLWNRYQVPVFEQFLGMDGELLAAECEIHHGLHVREEAAEFESGEEERLLVSFLANPRLPLLRLETGLCGRLVEEPCPCGNPAPRLVDLRRRVVRPRAAAAKAFAAAAVS